MKENALVVKGLKKKYRDFTLDDVSFNIRLESYQRLYTAINQLSDIQRRRLTLYFIENLTYRQIAKNEGVSQTVVDRSIKRALNQLCKLLAE